MSQHGNNAHQTNHGRYSGAKACMAGEVTTQPLKHDGSQKQCLFHHYFAGQDVWYQTVALKC